VGRLLADLDLDVRVCVRTEQAIREAVAEVPDLDGYVVCNILFDRPSPTALQEFLAMDWSPEVTAGNDQVLYLGFQNAAKTKLTNAKIEKALGVGTTARAPATLRKLL
jgi:hypothetical protein